MRVVAGSLSGRRLQSPSDRTVRPTADRVREAVFNALYSRFSLEGLEVLDLFAGSGALGIEALSRGAERVTFVDSSEMCIQTVKSNLESCDLLHRADLVMADGPIWLLEESRKWDLILLDPPYSFTNWSNLLGDHLIDLVNGLVVTESDREFDPGFKWNVDFSRRYGSTVVMFLTPTLDG